MAGQRPQEKYLAISRSKNAHFIFCKKQAPDNSFEIERLVRRLLFATQYISIKNSFFALVII